MAFLRHESDCAYYFRSEERYFRGNCRSASGGPRTPRDRRDEYARLDFGLRIAPALQYASARVIRRPCAGPRCRRHETNSPRSRAGPGCRVRAQPRRRLPHFWRPRHRPAHLRCCRLSLADGRHSRHGFPGLPRRTRRTHPHPPRGIEGLLRAPALPTPVGITGNLSRAIVAQQPQAPRMVESWADMEPISVQHYALGSTDAEQARLIRQAALLAPFTERFFRGAGIGPGQRVLDIGSGVGTWPCWRPNWSVLRE